MIRRMSRAHLTALGGNPSTLGLALRLGSLILCEVYESSPR